MEEVLEYLAMKNHYYEKFFTVTSKFLESAAKNEWQDIEFYVDSRERILNIIRSYDHRIAQSMRESQLSEAKMEEYRTKVVALFEKRKELGDRIVALDLQLISAIDDFKNDTIRDLKKTVETQSQLDSFARHENPPPKRTHKIAKA